MQSFDVDVHDPTQDNDVGYQLKSASSVGPFGRLGHVIIKTPGMSPRALAVIAYRSTFTGPFALHRVDIKRKLGIGKDSFYDIIEELELLTLIERTQTGAHVNELLKIDAVGDYVVVPRSLFAPSIQPEATAVWLMTRTMQPGLFAKELADRFVWSKNTTGKWCRVAVEHCLVEMILPRSVAGRYQGARFRAKYIPRAPEPKKPEPVAVKVAPPRVARELNERFVPPN